MASHGLGRTSGPGPRRLLPAPEGEVSRYLEQAALMLRFRPAWEEAIASGDQTKALAFVSKSCKLLAASVDLLKHLRQRDLTWAAMFVQARFRSRVEQRRFKGHLYRFKVMREMVETERSYMRSMGIVESIYKSAASRVLSPADVNTLFLNIAELRAANTTFWTSMESRLKEWTVASTVGELFVLLKDVIGEYISFVRGHDSALRLHEKLLGVSKYAKAMDECIETAGGLTLGAYLILPIQRFPRYQLLIKDMLKHTDRDHPDHDQLARALEEVSSHCKAINEATRNTEHYLHLVKIEGLTGVRLTDKPNRMLRREIDVQENIGGKWVAQSVLLFDDLILSVIKKTTKIVEVQWKVTGNNAHLVGDPAAQTFEMIEYRAEGVVKHVFRTASNVPPQIPLWSETLHASQTPLDKYDHKRLRNLGTSTHYQKDAIVVKAHELINGIYEVDQGTVGTVAQMGKHVRLQMSEHNRGAFFGFECMLRDAKFPYEAVCISQTCNVCFIPFDRLTKCLVQDPLLGRRFWHDCCVSLAESFFLWTLPKTIESHYLLVTGGDSNLRKTLAPVFAAFSAFRDPVRDAKTLKLFSVPPSCTIVDEFEGVTFVTGGKERVGTLYVGSSHLCFSSTSTGPAYRKAISFAEVGTMAADANNSAQLNIVMDGKLEKFQVCIQRAAFVPILGAHAKWKRNSARPISERSTLQRASAAPDVLLDLSDAEWDVIYAACDHVRIYQKGERILQEGDVSPKVFRIGYGKCRVEVESENTALSDQPSRRSSQLVGYMGAGELFGERCFLFNGSASASVIAEVETEVHALDRALLERLFFSRPELAGGFFKRLAFCIEGRLSNRNAHVLQRYSTLLAQKLKGGDLSKEGLFSTVRGGSVQLVRVGRAIRKESLSELSKYIPKPK